MLRINCYQDRGRDVGCVPYLHQVRHLGVEHLVKLLAGLLLDESVGEHASAMDQAAERFAVQRCVSDLSDRRRYRRRIADVGGKIVNGRAGRLNACEGVENFAVGQDLFALSANGLWRNASGCPIGEAESLMPSARSVES